MAVKDFITISDAKQTVEKAVPEKPTLAELTTVESPGRSSPANMLESGERERKKVRRSGKRKFEKSEETKITDPEKDSILIITEKPQAAEKIANALGSPKKIGEYGVNFFEIERNNKKIIVASAVGHLFNLTYVKGQKGWPIFNIEWQPSYERKSSAFTKRYFDLLNKLSKRAKEYIVATDYDTEGEVIGWNVLRFICKQNTAKRMKFSTLTSEELEKAYENPLQELSWDNAFAGESRHYLDWLYGINLSRALMSAIKKTGSFRILSIGRVQGPALKIIVDREKEILGFKSQPYWQVFALINRSSEEPPVLEFKHPKDIFEKKELEKFNKITEAIAETKKTEESLPPPVPFDLTTLQRESYRLYKITPSETLSIAQKLYLNGLISYPRTSSQKIPESIEPKKILKKLERYFPEAKLITRKKPIEGKKSDPAHPSIYPTGEHQNISGKEEKLYSLIAKRFIAAFSADALTANKRIILTSGDITFTASGLVILDKGWTSFYPVKIEENNLPDLEGKVKIDEIKIIEKETQPPNRYTPASLVTLLEKKNLGTKSTRSMIIETLFNRGYLEGESIKATHLGTRLIETLEKYSPIIIDENLTRQLEEEMESMHGSKEDLENKEKNLLEKVKRVITDISKEFKAQETLIGQDLVKGLEHLRAAQVQANTIMPCQTCKKGDLRIMFSKKNRRYFIACSNYPECRQTYSVPPNALIKKSEKNCEADNFPRLLAIRKGKRPWEFCFNPECPVEKKKREEWQAKKNNKSATE